MDLSLWMTFVPATVVVSIIHGPTIVLVLTYALTQGRRVAVASAAGVAPGDFIAMTARHGCVYGDLAQGGVIER